MARIYKHASVEGTASSSLTQGYELQMNLVPLSTGSIDIIFDGGAYTYTLDLSSGSVPDSLQAFVDAEGTNILNDTGFIVDFDVTFPEATLLLDSTGATADITITSVGANTSPTLTEVREGSTGGAGQPQITDVTFVGDGPFPQDFNDGTIGIKIDAGATFNVNFGGGFGGLESTLDAFIGGFGGSILAVHNFTVTRVGSNILRFTGADNVTTGVVAVVSDLSADTNASSADIQSASTGTLATTQLDKIAMANATPSGTWDLRVVRGSVVKTYTFNHNTGSIRDDIRNFAIQNYFELRSLFGINIGTRGTATAADMYLQTRDTSVSWTASVINDTSNTSPTITQVQAASFQPGDSTLGYSAGTMLYGYTTTDAKYIAIMDQKDRISNIEVGDWIGTLENEFSIAIFVTASNGSRR
jgi:hypothetical protein